LIYEDLDIKEKYFDLTDKLISRLRQDSILGRELSVIAICGESGSGKSITASCLKKGLADLGIESAILHQDNYYKLPPKDNHERRKADLDWVGINEVRIDLLQQHISDYKSGCHRINRPIVDYLNNRFIEEELDLKNTSILIVEGVYAFLLDKLDYKIFIARSYIDTKNDRKKRTRESYDPFVESVLQIEHQIITKLGENSDLSISKDYLLL